MHLIWPTKMDLQLEPSVHMSIWRNAMAASIWEFFHGRLHLGFFCTCPSGKFSWPAPSGNFLYMSIWRNAMAASIRDFFLHTIWEFFHGRLHLGFLCTCPSGGTPWPAPSGNFLCMSIWEILMAGSIWEFFVHVHLVDTRPGGDRICKVVKLSLVCLVSRKSSESAPTLRGSWHSPSNRSGIFFQNPRKKRS